MVKRFVDLGESWKQDNIHISRVLTKVPKNAKLGVETKEGIVYEPNIDIRFGRKLTNREYLALSKLLQSKKINLLGSTMHPDKQGFNLYNISKIPNNNYEKINKKVEALVRSIKTAPDTRRIPKESRERSCRELRNYGKKEGGATRSYAGIRSEIRKVSKKVKPLVKVKPEIKPEVKPVIKPTRPKVAVKISKELSEKIETLKGRRKSYSTKVVENKIVQEMTTETAESRLKRQGRKITPENIERIKTKFATEFTDEVLLPSMEKTFVTKDELDKKLDDKFDKFKKETIGGMDKLLTKADKVCKDSQICF